jgi:hypothetical protein
MKILQMNLIFLLKPHQSTNVIVLAIPLLNLSIIRFRTHVIPLAQLAKLTNRPSHCLHKSNALPTK